MMDQPPEQSVEEQQRTVVLRDLQEAWNNGDLAVLEESLHPECVGHFPSSAEIRGPEAVKQLVAGFRDALVGLRMEADDVITAGDRVVVRWTATCAGASARKAVAFTGITIDRFEDGQIVESWSEWDSAGLAAQLD